jgi:hypothetical protein
MLLASLVAAFGVTVFAANAGARTAMGPLRVCAYYSVNDVTTTANVKVHVAGAAGSKGAFVLKGNAANTTVHFKVRTNGTAFTSFPVTTPGGEHVTITIGSQTRALSLALPAGGNIKPQEGCTPK